ncbi:MAG: hypothetical protein EBZ48_01020 [Proteobacteria bacterium]|nr:hypothetical protein [Pseudomonadota bacterium]
MSNIILRNILGIALAGAATGCALFQNPGSRHLMKAEEFSRQEQYDKAIEEYRQHMQYRLALEKRPEWENPYFYLILIGDLQLIQDKPADARLSLQEAESRGVDVNLISDRYRSLAHWYEKKGDLNMAFTILKERREQDPILFDAMLDRIAKKIVAAADAGAPTALPAQQK